MSIKLEVKLTEQEYEDLMEKARDQVRREITEDTMKEWLGSFEHLPLEKLLKWYRISDRHTTLINQLGNGDKKELTKADHLLISIYALMY